MIEILIVRTPTHAQQLVLGIVAVWVGGAGNAAWFGLWRLAGKPPWMLENAYINGFWVWMICVGGVLHLTAPRAIDGRIPRSNWVGVTSVLIASFVLAWVLIANPPDASLIADWLEPYLSSAP